jgi:tRNA pseudouridine55 synthase
MPLILVDKPEGPTSHAVVSTIKRALGADKVGHLGTLDPFASGLLPILVGNTARLADEAMNGEKGYLFTIGFGRETDTLDPTGRVVAEAALPTQLTATLIDSALNNFRGLIEQVPPVYSALKMNGMPLYQHMRATGKLPVDIESKRRQVTVHSMSCLDFTEDSLTLRVVCSKGTYVRSLARDIAKTLGTVGTCIKLRREWVEPWHVDSALKVFLEATGRIAPPEIVELKKACQPPWNVAPKLKRAALSIEHKARFLSGNPIEVESQKLEWIKSEKEQASEGELQVLAGSKVIVECDDAIFLCDLDFSQSGSYVLQPRKKIS